MSFTRSALALDDPLLSLCSSGLFRARMPSRKSYIRSDDGAVMVEISPCIYVERQWAERQGLLR